MLSETHIVSPSILNEVRYVELSGRTDFNDRFVDELKFPG